MRCLGVMVTSLRSTKDMVWGQRTSKHSDCLQYTHTHVCSLATFNMGEFHACTQAPAAGAGGKHRCRGKTQVQGDNTGAGGKHRCRGKTQVQGGTHASLSCADTGSPMLSIARARSCLRLRVRRVGRTLMGTLLHSSRTPCSCQ
jgi:hypothetical protein